MQRDRRADLDFDADYARGAGGRAAGKGSLTARLAGDHEEWQPSPLLVPATAPLSAVQARAADDAFGLHLGADVPRTAAAGVASAASPLPHANVIQASFGAHDISDVRAAIGGDASAAAGAIGATAYATGNRIAFGADPDLHLAAHEAAHVVQQRAGVQLDGGVGTRGDTYEQHADRVADLVVRGESAEAALGAPTTGAGTAAVQRSGVGFMTEAALEAVWPTGSGWRYTGDLQSSAAAELAGVGIDCAAVQHGSITISREGFTFILQVESSRGAGGIAEAEIFLGGGLGAYGQRARSLEIGVDLAAATWPANLGSLLQQGQFVAAASALFQAGALVWKGTTIKVSAGMSAAGVGEAGAEVPGVAGAGIGVGLEVSGEMTRESGPDGRVDEWSLSFETALSGAVEIPPEIRSALAELSSELPRFSPMRNDNVDPDSPAWRDGNYLPGPSDSANSVNGALATKLRLRRTTPSTAGKPVTWQIGLAAEVTQSLAVAGQIEASRAEVAAMMDVNALRAFVAAIKSGQPLTPAMLPVIEMESEGALTIQDVTTLGPVPGFDVGALPGVDDRADAVKTTLGCKIVVDLPKLHPLFTNIASAQQTLFGPVMQAFTNGAFVSGVHALLAAMRAQPSMLMQVFHQVIKELTLEIEVTDDGFFDAGTPGYGELPGMRAQGRLDSSKVSRIDLGPGAPGVTPMLIARLAYFVARALG